MLKLWVNFHTQCTPWKFYYAKVMGEFFTQSVHRENFTLLKSWVNFQTRSTQRKFHFVKVMGEVSYTVYTVKVSLWKNHR